VGRKKEGGLKWRMNRPPGPEKKKKKRSARSSEMDQEDPTWKRGPRWSGQKKKKRKKTVPLSAKKKTLPVQGGKGEAFSRSAPPGGKKKSLARDTAKPNTPYTREREGTAANRGGPRR